MSAIDVNGFLDTATNTIAYIVSDRTTRHAAIIDSVLDFDLPSGRTATTSADALLDYVASQDLIVDWILETHVHADHVSAAAYLKERTGAKVAIGRQVTDVQHTFGSLYNLKTLDLDGSQFDHLFDDGETFKIGNTTAQVLATPGHTPACITYVVDGAAFVGDTLFMPDYGTARTDFPGGDAEVLFDSIQKILSLPEDTRLYMCHDYKAPGRTEFAWETTVREQQQNNIHIGGGIDKNSFVAMRRSRDVDLDVPKLLLPSIQVNICAGRLPAAEDNSLRYLKIPLDAL